MAVYVALFGEKNYEWPECLVRSTIATPSDIDDFALWRCGDREAYIRFHIEGRGRRKEPPTRVLASRWYNDKTRFSESAGDVWIHKQDGRVWWTRSIDEPPFFIEKDVPFDPGRTVIVCHKPCEPWRHVSEIGTDLKWEILHPRAQVMLNSRITLQTLRDESEAYMMSLLRGEDLSDWHDRPDWRALAGPGWKDADADLTALDRAVARMAQMAYQTSLQSNGQKVLTTARTRTSGSRTRRRWSPISGSY